MARVSGFIQGIYSSALGARFPSTTRRLFTVVDYVLKAISAYLLGLKGVRQEIVVHRSVLSWSHKCAAAESPLSDAHNESGEDGDEQLEEDGSSSCSVADTVYSLPDVVAVSDLDLDLTDTWIIPNPHLKHRLTPAFLHQVSAACANPSWLPRQLFLPVPAWSRRRSKRTRKPSQSLGSSDDLTSLELCEFGPDRSASSWFVPSCPLLLPAPIFLPASLEVGLFCDQGPRTYNEDMAFAMRLDPAMHHAGCFEKSVVVGVFDGHGGAEVAEHLTAFLPDEVSRRCKDIKERGVEEIATIMSSFEVDLQQRYQTEWEPADRDPGSTALVAAIMDDTLLIANVGDCRLLLISEALDHLGNRTAFVSKATSDHHCIRNEKEARRVREAGSFITESGHVGALLELSRSIGDFQTKLQLGSDVILSEPEVYTWKLGPEHLLAVAVSDGISSVMNDMDICNMVCTELNDRRGANDPARAARELAKYAACTSSDNCSAVVVVLKEQPPPTPARRKLFARKG